MNLFQPKVAFHPGLTLSEKLSELQMGPKEFAIRTDKPEKTIISIIKGDSSVTPETALAFEAVLKIPANFWINMQRTYDEFKARESRRETLLEAVNWAKLFPLSEMIKKEWLPERKTIEEKTYELLSFFSFNSHLSWEKYYFNQQLKIAFRASLAHTQESHAISAWLRKGELQAQKVVANPYSEKALKESLPKLKNIMFVQPIDFFEQIQLICLEAGVKVVYTPPLNKVPVNGCARWINDAPLIQLTNRYKRNDVFWFSFFHEVGHILLHGKKEVFIENIDYKEKSNQKEIEADDFAIKWTLTKEQENEIMDNDVLNESIIVDYANKFKTHPAIIVGRLQYNKKIDYSEGKSLFVKISLN